MKLGSCTQCDEYNQLAVSIEPADQGLVSPRGVGHVHGFGTVSIPFLALSPHGMELASQIWWLHSV